MPAFDRLWAEEKETRAVVSFLAQALNRNHIESLKNFLHRSRTG